MIIINIDELSDKNKKRISRIIDLSLERNWREIVALT